MVPSGSSTSNDLCDLVILINNEIHVMQIPQDYLKVMFNLPNSNVNEQFDPLPLRHFW